MEQGVGVAISDVLCLWLPKGILVSLRRPTFLHQQPTQKTWGIFSVPSPALCVILSTLFVFGFVVVAVILSTNFAGDCVLTLLIVPILDERVVDGNGDRHDNGCRNGKDAGPPSGAGNVLVTQGTCGRRKLRLVMSRFVRPDHAETYGLSADSSPGPDPPPKCVCIHLCVYVSVFVYWCVHMNVARGPCRNEAAEGVFVCTFLPYGIYFT